MLGGLWPWPSVFGLLLINLVAGHACKLLCARIIAHRAGGSLHTTLVLWVPPVHLALQARRGRA